MNLCDHFHDFFGNKTAIPFESGDLFKDFRLLELSVPDLGARE
jgi:hypothetical protein